VYHEAVHISKVENALVNLRINVTDCAMCSLVYIYIYIYIVCVHACVRACVCVCVTSAYKSNPTCAGCIHNRCTKSLPSCFGTLFSGSLHTVKVVLSFEVVRSMQHGHTLANVIIFFQLKHSRNHSRNVKMLKR
jgi:hypothetical protein